VAVLAAAPAVSVAGLYPINPTNKITKNTAKNSLTFMIFLLWFLNRKLRYPQIYFKLNHYNLLAQNEQNNHDDPLEIFINL